MALGTDLAARLAESARRVPDRIALLWQDRSVTYRELDERATAAAGALQKLGVLPGDRVALYVGNTPHFVEAFYGILRAGGVVVPLNTALTRPEVAHVIADSGARVLIAMEAAIDLARDVRDAVPELEQVVVTGVTGAVPGTTAHWRELIDSASPYTPVTRAPDDLAALVYTSGTTGTPKGAMLTHRNLTANQDQVSQTRMAITEDDVVLAVLPLFHIYALNVGLGASIHAGASVLLVERFDPVGTLDLVGRHGATVVLGAPPMYIAWLNTADVDEVDFGKVRFAVSGAAPLPAPVLRRFEEEFKIPIWEGYGLTEASPAVTSNAMGEHPRPNSVGRPLPGIEVRIVDADDRVAEAGDPGEVHVRGDNVFQGYWPEGRAGTDVVTRDGWLRTGDVGYLDGDNNLYLVDRRRDLVIVSGFNVYPREVELVLERHPKVTACAVVGVPHPYTGEAVKAFVVPGAGHELTEEELVAWCRRSLARFKCPEIIEFVRELPYSTTGKVLRRVLRTA